VEEIAYDTPAPPQLDLVILSVLTMLLPIASPCTLRLIYYAPMFNIQYLRTMTAPSRFFFSNELLQLCRPYHTVPRPIATYVLYSTAS